MVQSIKSFALAFITQSDYEHIELLGHSAQRIAQAVVLLASDGSCVACEGGLHGDDAEQGLEQPLFGLQ